jgi:hypothetical protein
MLRYIFPICSLVLACGGLNSDPDMGEGEPVVESTQPVYQISFNTAPGGLPRITCLGADPPDTWSYYGNICSGEDGIRSKQLFYTYGRRVPYEDEGCVCVRVLDPSYKCWMTSGVGPDLQRDKPKLRILRSTIALTSSNWIHRDALNYTSECTVQLMQCQTNVGCPVNPVPF